MKLLFGLLVVNASPTAHFQKQVEEFKKCTKPRSKQAPNLRNPNCVHIINEFKQDCYELNAQPLPEGNLHKEWVNKK